MEKWAYESYLRCNDEYYVDANNREQVIRKPGFIPIRINANKIPTDLAWNTNPPELEYNKNQIYGMMPPANVVVVDVDVKNNHPGIDSWLRFLADNYTQDEIKQHFIRRDHPLKNANVKTPSGGAHFYIEVGNNNYQDIPKTHPRYPGLDFITHGKSQVVAGNQILANGEYIFEHMGLFPPLKSLECFVDINVHPEEDRASQIPKKTPQRALTPFTAEQIRKFLTFIPAEDYEVWYKVGLSLLDSSLPEEEANKLWHQWSATSEKYTEQDAEKRWQQLRGENAKTKHKHITISSLPHFAKEYSPSSEKEINQIIAEGIDNYQDLSGRFLFIQVKKKSATPYYDLLTKDSCSIEYVKKELHPLMNEVRIKHKLKKEPSIDTLITLGHIKTVKAEIYVPQSNEVVVTRGGVDYLNTYDPSSIPQPIDYSPPHDEDVKFFVNHVRIIFGEYANDFFDFIAHLVQNPGEKIRYMLVLQGGYGTGKGQIIAAIKNHVLGVPNCRSILSDLFFSENNSLLFNKQLIVVEELKVDSRHSKMLMNRVKVMITENTAVCTEKYQVSTELPNVASFIALTNHKDCLKDADKRRYHAVISPIQDVKSIEYLTNISNEIYFKRLAKIVDKSNPNGGQLRKFFLDYQISKHFNPAERPANSDFKRIEKENLDTNEKWADYIDLVRYVYKCELLPNYIDCELLLKKYKDINPDTGASFFPPEEKIELRMLRRFGRAFGYKIYFRCLYNNQLLEEDAKKYIKKLRSGPSLS